MQREPNGKNQHPKIDLTASFSYFQRNGAEFSLYVNTGQEYDGSDSGAHPDEAVSWGKIKMDSKPVKVFCDATIAFPFLVAETFAKKYWERQANGVKE